ncbi:MAG TPA: VOC family protein [Gemmatimonadaceae bacterium]|nr:VOC family protein [Gemmatimonadaceae bacterium]
MKIKLTTVYVNDQEKALRFYTQVLGFVKKADFSQGPFRWLTVASPDEPDGTELQLALNNNPAAQTYQQAMFDQNQPAAMFYVDDVQREYDRMKPLGAEFTMPPTKVTGSTIAMLKDTCGNLIQLVVSRPLAGLIIEARRRLTGRRRRASCSSTYLPRFRMRP